MSDWVKFMCYADGNIIMSDDGVDYDSFPKTLIKVDLGTKYEELEGILAEGLAIDLSVQKLEINHRYPMRKSERTNYVLIPIRNDKDVFLLIDFAVDMGKIQCPQLYINKHPFVEDGSIPSVNSPSVDVHRTLRTKGWNSQCRITGISSSQDVGYSGMVPLFASDSNVLANDREIEVPLPYFQHSGGNGYITFEEEHRGCLDDWSFSDELKKGMRWDTKEQLMHAAKMHHILNHHDFKVERSNKTLWCVKCVKKEMGCKWRLRAGKKKYDNAFEISIIEGPHTCVNPVLSSDRGSMIEPPAGEGLQPFTQHYRRSRRQR